MSLSGEFQLTRGVKQGSVLSPPLFLLVIELESSGTEASIGGIYYGSLGQSDDLQSITVSIALLEEQAAVYPGKWPTSKYEKISFCLNSCLKPLVSSPWLLEIL